MEETFWTLLQSEAHWKFELFLMFLFDFVLGVVLLPFAKKIFSHHDDDHTELDALRLRIEQLEQHQPTPQEIT